MTHQVGASATMRRLSGSDAFYKSLILFAALIWGGSFIVQKTLVNQFSALQVMTVNFLGGGLTLLVASRGAVIGHLDAKTVRTGVFIGVLSWLAYIFQTTGISLTTPGKSAFISGCYCVLVPFIGMLAGIGRPEPHNIVAALLCAAGLGCIGLDGGLPLNLGDVLSLASAFAFAVVFVMLAKVGDGVDSRALTVWQLLTIGVLSLATSLIVDRPPAPEDFTPVIIGCFLYEAVLNACLCNALVNFAFTKVDPTSGSLISSLESPIGAVISLAAGADRFTPRLGIGFVLVFLAVIVSEAWRGLKARLVRAIEGAPRQRNQRQAGTAAEPSPSEAASGPSRRLVPPLANESVAFATRQAGEAPEMSETRRGDWCPLPYALPQQDEASVLDGFGGFDGLASELDGIVSGLVDCEETPSPDARLVG